MKHVINLIVGSALSFVIGLIIGAGIGGYEYEEICNRIKKNGE